MTDQALSAASRKLVKQCFFSTMPVEWAVQNLWAAQSVLRERPIVYVPEVTKPAAWDVIELLANHHNATVSRAARAALVSTKKAAD